MGACSISALFLGQIRSRSQTQNPEDKSLHIQLMGPGEASVDDARTSVNRWREYVDSYVTEYSTEWTQGVGHGHQPRLFVRRYGRIDQFNICALIKWTGR